MIAWTVATIFAIGFACQSARLALLRTDHRLLANSYAEAIKQLGTAKDKIRTAAKTLGL